MQGLETVTQNTILQGIQGVLNIFFPCLCRCCGAAVVWIVSVLLSYINQALKFEFETSFALVNLIRLTGTAQRFKSEGLNGERSELRWGSGGTGKFFETTPLRTSENAPFKERCAYLCPY